jgi:Ser/Thr protein kinase RdoA (MazF antagonist)
MGVARNTLIFGARTVTKRYAAWDRGEPRREWAALRHIYRHAPDLAPTPVAAGLDDVPPSVTMTIVPGQPLTTELSTAQASALAAAIRDLWTVPVDDAYDVQPWSDDLAFARRLTDGPRPDEPTTAAAYDAAVRWWQGPDPDLLRSKPSLNVIGHRDPNPSNYLWDGRRMRIIDFEDSAISDPTTELAILIEHLGTRQMDTTSVCAEMRVDQYRLLAARRVFAMFWLALLLPGGPAVHRNPLGTTQSQALRLLRLLDA